MSTSDLAPSGEPGGEHGTVVRNASGRLPFGLRLVQAMGERGPLCVGIDPHPCLLEVWGLPDTPGGLRDFSLRVVEAMSGHVAAVKPQAAFFERHGSAGIAVLEEVLRALRDTGTLSVLDVKRGDIGSTMGAYAQAYLADGAPAEADAITVSPYLGYGSLAPALELASATGRGVFVLALTSNPEGPGVQHARGPDGRPVAAGIVEAVTEANKAARESGHLGDVGLVVGATVGSAVAELGIDLLAANAALLAPGVGAQGAGPDELRAVFGRARRQVLVSASRSVLRAGPATRSLRQAALASREEAAAALRQGR